MSRDGFLIKIVPPGGYDVYRLHLSRTAVGVLAGAIVAVILAGLGIHGWQLHASEESVRALQSQTAVQGDRLSAIDRQADALAGQLRSLQRENAEIRRLLGVPAPKPAPRATQAAAGGAAPAVADLQERLRGLAQGSHAAAADQARLVRLAHHVLDLRRLAGLARDRMLASIPSIMPVDGEVSAGFGWRSSPWPEFHRGVDVAADYGSAVRATGAGIVVSAGWSGGYGIKVDVDHGNGYHTWYAHLSRTLVSAGEHVRRGQRIASVGLTGETTGPHLHYQMMRFGEAIDPAPYLAGIPREVLASLPDPARVH